jgi:hypothetical protein
MTRFVRDARTLAMKSWLMVPPAYSAIEFVKEKASLKSFDRHSSRSVWIGQSLFIVTQW